MSDQGLKVARIEALVGHLCEALLTERADGSFEARQGVIASDVRRTSTVAAEGSNTGRYERRSSVGRRLSAARVAPEDMPPADKLLARVRSQQAQLAKQMHKGKQDVEKQHAHLSRKEVADIRASFTHLDTDQNGVLDAAELKTVMRMLGMHVEHATVDAMIKEGDTDGSGTLNFDEFLAALQHSSVGKSSLAELRMGELSRKVAAALGTQTMFTIGTSKYLVHPLSPQHILWDMFVTTLLVVTLIIMPVSLAFEGFNDRMFSLNLAIDVLFLCDVVKQFNTGFVRDRESEIVMDRKTITRAYLKSWFFIDFVSSIPIDALMRLAAGSGGSGSELLRSSKLLKMLRLLRLAKLLKLLRISRVAKYGRKAITLLEDKYNITISSTVMKFARLFFLVVLLAHWMGCIFFMICRLFGEPDAATGTWLYPDDSWVAITGLDAESETTQYVWSLFKALCLIFMMGFESPPPMNSQCASVRGSFLSEWCQVESWLTLGGLMVGSVFYAVLIANVSTIIHSMHAARQEYVDKFNRVGDWMKTKRLPVTLRDKVSEAYRIKFREGKMYNEQEILDELNDYAPGVLTEILEFNSREILNLVPILREAPHRFQERLATSLHAEVVFKDEVIFAEGEMCDYVYFILSGLVDIVKDEGTNGEVLVASIGDGSYFGDTSLLLGVPHSASARCKTQCVMYRAHNDAFLKLFEDFPSMKQIMLGVVAQRLGRNEGRKRSQNGGSLGLGGSASRVVAQTVDDNLALSGAKPLGAPPMSGVRLRALSNAPACDFADVADGGSDGGSDEDVTEL